MFGWKRDKELLVVSFSFNESKGHQVMKGFFVHVAHACSLARSTCLDLNAIPVIGTFNSPTVIEFNGLVGFHVVTFPEVSSGVLMAVWASTVGTQKQRIFVLKNGTVD